ncbi:MAG: ATP-binding protein, partial [Spirochaetota bacterium]
MRIAVASGKGGTGKTTVAVNLALSLQHGERVRFIDCDVEEPNAHLFLKPRIDQVTEATIPVPRVDEERCTSCGMCAEVCAYNALAVITGKNGVKGRVLVFDHLCHGCGACARLCPARAVREEGMRIGVIEAGRAGPLAFAQGRLDVGRIMSPPLIRQLKERALPWGGNTRTAGEDGEEVLILDAPPGTSCPVIAAVRGCDRCILVTEPTPFGMHDLELAAGMLRRLGVPAGVVINRDGVGDQGVERFCEEYGLPVLLRIPFSEEIASLYARGIPVVGELPGMEQRFRELY